MVFLERFLKQKPWQKSPRFPVISIEVPDEEIVDRITGRFSCANCGMVFHDKFNPLPADGCPGGEFEEKRRADEMSILFVLD